MILARDKILEAVRDGDIIIEPFDEALVGPASVDLHLAAVVDPRDAKHQLPVGLDDPLEDGRLTILWPTVEHRHQRGNHLVDGLVKLGLAGIFARDMIHEIRGTARHLRLLM